MSRGPHNLPWSEYVRDLAAHERPTLPGSPATPDHPTPRRVQVRPHQSSGHPDRRPWRGGRSARTCPHLAGDLGVSTTEAAWLPVVYRDDQRLHEPAADQVSPAVRPAAVHPLMLGSSSPSPSPTSSSKAFGSEIAVRAVAGICAAGMSSLGILYMIQAFPAAHRLKGLVIGIGLSSFTLPIARIASNPLIDLAGWERALPVRTGSGPAVAGRRVQPALPPSQRLTVYEPLDFLTFALFAPGIALLCAVLGLGRLVWWTEAPWIGWALIGSIVLLGAALIIEYNRRNPLINLRWMASGDLDPVALDPADAHRAVGTDVRARSASCSRWAWVRPADRSVLGDPGRRRSRARRPAPCR
jgi:hypothetical protein